jgi:unsaturated rhamnogalacturonyl hydrolase
MEALIMIGQKKLHSHRVIFELSIIVLIVLAATLFASQMPESKPQPAGDRPVSLNPDRLVSNYPVYYGRPTIESVRVILTRILLYLDGCTPARMVDFRTGEPVTFITRLTDDSIIERGSFPIVSYEWGVTYSGMLLAGEATGDARFTGYTARRLKFLAEIFPHYKTKLKNDPKARSPIRSIVDPRSLDDSGSMCAAMIKARRAGAAPDVQPMIDNYIGYIRKGQMRLEDGTFCRNRPFPDSLWLDDLYMSVPALAQMGYATGEAAYFDDAAGQILQFADRMFVKEKNLYMHGWVQDMELHPVFHWARANGWALMAKTELLEVLPENHPARARLLELLRNHIRGLAACQSGQGLWHQLLDRNDSYLETSSSAMFTYCIARAINRGWISAQAHLPMLQVAWNAVAAKVNAQGQVEGTCIGTGMGFDPMFYYYRPTSVFAAHGYGSVLLAGAEMINMLKKP